MPAPREFIVLHYVGYNDDRGGIVSVVRALASTNRFACVLGVNAGFQQRRAPALATVELPELAGEQLGLATFWRARMVATRVREWLAKEPERVFHGHSRAGLAVAFWLDRMKEARVVASVHCYGRHRWFYRGMARRLGNRLFWLSPAMKRYYGVFDDKTPWKQCIPGCVPFESPSVRPAAARATSVVQFGGIGALVRWKGWHVVLEALASLPPATREKVRFTHIGGTDASIDSERYATELRSRTAALHLESIVDWRGEQPSARPFLAECDCLLIASDREPFSVAMLEALTAGVPVLAANSGGATDVVTASRNGWLFEGGDARDLARMLAMLATTDVLKSVRIDPEVMTRFSATVVASQWAQAYERVSAMR